MAEDVGQEFLPDTQVKRGLLEGRLMGGRNLSDYESVLGFKAQELEGKRVLNVGAGVSRLDRDLRKQGIRCTLVDFDLKDVKGGFMARLFSIARSLEDRHHEAGLDKKAPAEEPTKVERAFVRGDARSLPFKKSSFDYAFCLWMLYQIPEEEKGKVFDSLMAVSDRVYLGPVGKVDIGNLRKRADEKHFDLRIHRKGRDQSVILTRKSLTREG